MGFWTSVRSIELEKIDIRNRYFTQFVNQCRKFVLGFVVFLGLIGFSFQSVAAAPSTRVWPDEKYSQEFTNEMAEEIAAWVLEAYPELPFKEPNIEIHEDGIHCSGLIELFGVDIEASGLVFVFLDDGKVNGKIEEISVAGMPVPGLLLDAVGEVRDLYADVTWEIEVTNVELSEGKLLIEGVYR